MFRKLIEKRLKKIHADIEVKRKANERIAAEIEELDKERDSVCPITHSFGFSVTRHHPLIALALQEKIERLQAKSESL